MPGFVKRRLDAPPEFFETEAAGLDWLRSAGGVRTASVLRVEPGLLELERVDEVAPSAESARRFGAALARTHRSGAAAFGSPPPGCTLLYIGNRPMAPANESSWGVFYARDRVLPFLEIAERVGNIRPDAAGIVREACDRVAAGELDDAEPPSRIHGDLWNGNVLWSADDVVLIDPAAHGGHRETDLAMLALFGCPFLEDVYAGYEATAPLRPGWRERTPLHQLHPLATHAAGHGASYGRALADAAERVLAL